MILASVPRRPHNVCRAERYNRQLPTQLINLTIYTVCERHALTSHNSGYYGYGSAVSPERGARLSGRSLAEHVAVSIGRKRLSGSTTLETSLALDVIGCIRDACVRASVWRGKYILEEHGGTQSWWTAAGEGMRHQISPAVRSVYSHCARFPSAFGLPWIDHSRHTRKVYMPGILERIDAIARIISNVPRLWSSLRRVPWQWTRGRTQSVWLRKFTRFCAIIVWPIIVRTTKGKFRERLWCIVCWGSVTKSVRDVSKLHKYVYIERNINDDVNKQFVITMKIVIRVFENIRNERDGIYVEMREDMLMKFDNSDWLIINKIRNSCRFDQWIWS